MEIWGKIWAMEDFFLTCGDTTDQLMRGTSLSSFFETKAGNEMVPTESALRVLAEEPFVTLMGRRMKFSNVLLETEKVGRR